MTLVHYDSMVIRGGEIGYWTYIANIDKSLPYDLMTFYGEVDCSSNRYKTLFMETYLRGQRTESTQVDPSWSYYRPGTIQNLIMNKVCSPENRDSEKSILTIPDDPKTVALIMQRTLRKLRAEKNR